jgi:hypothetical protein
MGYECVNWIHLAQDLDLFVISLEYVHERILVFHIGQLSVYQLLNKDSAPSN